MVFACVKNGIVENTIVADQNFADSIAAQYDFVIRVDNLNPQPGIGWTYIDGEFSPPVLE